MKTHETGLVLTEEQERLISRILDASLRIHRVLVSESASGAAAEAHDIAGALEKIKASDSEGHLTGFTRTAGNSLEGLMSEDIERARDGFKLLSSALIDFVKGPGREKAISSDVRIFYCPMVEKSWLQEGADIRNPYLGRDMLACGTEEKY